MTSSAPVSSVVVSVACLCFVVPPGPTALEEIVAKPFASKRSCDSIGEPGMKTVHVPGTANKIETLFSGDSFAINGNDRCGMAPPVPGISATDPDLVTEIANGTLTDGGLDGDQMDNVIGIGGSPSVRVASQGPMTVSQMTESFLALPHAELDGGNYSSNESWGTAETPRITQIRGDARIEGTIEGYGVLIVDGALDIAGNFTFHGLVIARGDVEVQLNGNAGIFGSVLLEESLIYDRTVELGVRGNAQIRFDSCALASADTWVALPRAARLLAWQEKMSN